MIEVVIYYMDKDSNKQGVRMEHKGTFYTASTLAVPELLRGIPNAGIISIQITKLS